MLSEAASPGLTLKTKLNRVTPSLMEEPAWRGCIVPNLHGVQERAVLCATVILNYDSGTDYSSSTPVFLSIPHACSRCWTDCCSTYCCWTDYYCCWTAVVVLKVYDTSIRYSHEYYSCGVPIDVRQKDDALATNKQATIKLYNAMVCQVGTTTLATTATAPKVLVSSGQQSQGECGLW